jgi:hypothetical protein
VYIVEVEVESCLSFLALVLLLLLHLQQQGAVDVRQDTTEGDRRADEGVELFVAADGELQVAGGDTLDLEVLRGVLYCLLVVLLE